MFWSKKKKNYSTKCYHCVMLMMIPLLVSQVDSDWKADPVLEEACEEVVTAACDPKVSVNPSIQPLTRDNNLIDTGTYNQSINRVL